MTTHPSPAAGPVAAAVPAAEAAPGAAEEREVPVADIDPDDNARKHFDAEQTRALADNIAAHGLLNAVIIYRHPQSGRFRLVAGERRWRAVHLLGWKTVRARVLTEPPNDATRRELALIDNEQRQDLSDIERGLAYLGYMTATGSTASALANKLGKHVSTVTLRCADRPEVAPRHAGTGSERQAAALRRPPPGAAARRRGQAAFRPPLLRGPGQDGGATGRRHQERRRPGGGRLRTPSPARLMASG